MSDHKAAGTVLLTHEVGLHARPSVKFTKLAKRFSSAITFGVTAEGPWIDAKSIVRVMGAKVPQGTRLHLRAEGADADDAVAALIRLVEADFESADADAAGD